MMFRGKPTQTWRELLTLKKVFDIKEGEMNILYFGRQ
jgi:hypothetical protein